MFGKLHTLNQMLAYQLQPYRLLGRATQHGPRLRVVVEHMRGDEVNQEELQTLLESLLTAVPLPVTDVFVQLVCRQTGEITWEHRLPLTAAVSLSPLRDRKALLRQDYPLWRVSFFGLALVLGIIWWAQQQWVVGIPVVLALGAGVIFPVAKRSLLGIVDLWVRLGLLTAGVTCLGLGGWMAWVNGWVSVVPVALLGLSGWFLLGLAL
ncbi:MAG: hypothetical protein OHK0012_22690 [Synechococcales cyanobacterium]